MIWKICAKPLFYALELIYRSRMALPPRDQLRNILIIRRDNIGDLVCTTPLIHTVRQAYPNAYIGVLVNSYNEAVLEGNPDADGVYAYGKLKHQNGFFARLSAIVSRFWLLWTLRRKHFDLAILAKSGFDQHGLRMARWAGARNILGFDNETSSLLTQPVSPKGNADMHEVEAVAKLLTFLGIDDKPGRLRVYPDENVARQLQKKLLPHGHRKWIALHLSAREESRRWPAEKFIAAIKTMAASDIGFVLFWSPGQPENPTHPGDDPMAKQILASCNNDCVIAWPTKHLRELIAGVSCCDIFIGADGGAMHIAVAAGTPVVGLFENSDAKRKHWYPWQIAHRLLQPKTFAVADIEADAVVKATQSLLTEISVAKSDTNY